ncbi:hypothetical protein ACFQHV_20470 [Promicromonospora thailandica]|uniref:Ig-like domain-containing protein n=1 Tax=Promicromonospora thailandica TaxID=765201 RepID=A0A9X2G1W4_9MICO|nr:hypothetical protein [Promicromonospora thailandica]MCP2264143.1 hypothetical protein [Promicromonospora thailandica]BFF21193.1 hypothetical protein GCM10025730_47140 [Promicromonospora thailandica]
MIRRSIIALVSVLALALTASAPAYAAPAYSTNVTLDAKPEPVAKNKTVTLKGTLKYNRNGTVLPMGAKVLTVHFDPAGADGSRKVGTVRTTSKGAYTYTAKATRSGKWTVKYTSPTGAYKADSAADAVCVYPNGRWQCPVSSTNPDLDCSDIRRTVWVGTNDYHRLDADKDGWGCDSYSGR